MNFSFDSKEDIEDNINALLYADESEEYEKVLHKCIQKAQFYKDKDLEFDARVAYLRQTSWLNKKDKAIATMPWLLKRLDEGHNTDQLDTVLWMYKWIIIKLPSFASISVAQIEQLLNDMEKRFLDFGTGMRIVNYFRMIVYSNMGRLEQSKKYLQLYLQDNATCSLDDCRACQPNNLLGVYLNLRDYEAYFTQAAPLLARKVTCKEVPDYSYPSIAFVNYINGNYELAQEQALLGRKKIKWKKAVLGPAGYLLAYYGYTKDFLKGRATLEKQLDFCGQTQPELSLFTFYLGTLIFFKALHNEGKKQIKLKVEHQNLIPVKDGTCLVPEGLSWLEEKVDDLAQKLDHRNQNDFYLQEKVYFMGFLK